MHFEVPFKWTVTRVSLTALHVFSSILFFLPLLALHFVQGTLKNSYKILSLSHIDKQERKQTEDYATIVAMLAIGALLVTLASIAMRQGQLPKLHRDLLITTTALGALLVAGSGRASLRRNELSCLSRLA